MVPVKMVKENRNEAPTDSQGRPIKIGSLAKAEIFLEPKKVELDGKEWFLGPKVIRFYGKVIMVGLKKSLIEFNREVREVENDKIVIVA